MKIQISKKYQMSYENLNTSSSYIFRHLCQDMILVGSCILIGWNRKLIMQIYIAYLMTFLRDSAGLAEFLCSDGSGGLVELTVTRRSAHNKHLAISAVHNHYMSASKVSEHGFHSLPVYMLPDVVCSCFEKINNNLITSASLPFLSRFNCTCIWRFSLNTKNK
jgi:hypothetical protein